MYFYPYFLAYFLVPLTFAHNACVLRKTEKGTVCVCNSTYCDTVPRQESLSSGQYQLYSTSKATLGFASSIGQFSNTDGSSDATVTVSNLNGTHQTIYGFGGAFTDATGINILRLSKGAQKLLMESYFGKDGIEYTIGRIPIGGTDFSTRGYTYCDACNGSLSGFALQEEDYKYKIPWALKANELRGNKIKFFASIWSAPAWMKNSGSLSGKGYVKSEYYQLFAEYYLKFFDAYKTHNISFWGLTTQNEPINGVIGTDIPNNGFTSGQMKNWIKEGLGPAIRNSSYKDLKIMLHDDQRILLPILQLFVLSDSEVVRYADGIAVHWYSDFFTPAILLNLASSSEKKLFRLATEACSGFLASVDLEKPVDLGSWDRADYYLNDIIEDLNYDFTGWVDWNMALNETGGPNYVNNDVDSPIIVNGTADEFCKQPMYYALGHFSKFIVPDSVRVDVTTSGSDVSSLAFVRPDKKIAVILRNSSSKEKTIKVTILNSKQVVSVPAKSINTLLYAV